MTIATDSTVQVTIENDGARLLLLAILWDEITGASERVAGEAESWRALLSGDPREQYWAQSARLHKLEELVTFVSNPGTQTVEVPIAREVLLERLRSQVQFLWADNNLVMLESSRDQRERLLDSAVAGGELIRLLMMDPEEVEPAQTPSDGEKGGDVPWAAR